MRWVNASSLNSAVRLESSTPMARLALQTSGLYVCLLPFLQTQFSIRQLKYIYLQFAPCTQSKVFLTHYLIAFSCNECQEGSSVCKVLQLLSIFQLLTASSWLVIEHWTSLFSIIVLFGQLACWVILVFSVPQNLQSPIWIVFPQPYISQWQTLQCIHSSHPPISVFGLTPQKQIRSVRAATSVLVGEGHPSVQSRLWWLTPCEEMSLAPCFYSQMVNPCLIQF